MPTQIVEKSGEGLSRVYGVTIPAGMLSDKMEAKIAEIRPTMQLKGFRPGKVPASHVKKMYGRQIMGEIVQAAVAEANQQALEQGKVRPAAEPELDLDNAAVERAMAGEGDLAYELKVEVMPEFEPVDLAGLSLVRPVHAPTDEELDEQLAELAAQNRTYAAKEGEDAAAEDGDQLLVDFVGRIDGETFEGGSAEDAEVTIGSNRFIPGFEEQLTGARAGEEKLVSVTFPEEYGVPTLAGKAAEFTVTVKEVRAAQETALDDAFATQVGFEDLEGLRNAVRTQMEQQFGQASRFKAKRALLDLLDTAHDFALPPRMVEGEFQVIWRQVEAEREAGELSDEDKAKSDDDLRAEYRKIAERRVRLGLVLAEIGRRENVVVSDQELNGALMAEARKYPGQEREVFDFYRQNPQASAQLRAPIYEEKVVDLILERAQVEDQEVSKEALFAEDEMPEGYGDAKPAEAAAETAPTEAASEEAAPKPKKPRAKKASPEAAAEAAPEDSAPEE